jgi:hypothetical protein
MWQRWNGTSHIFEKSDDNGSTWAPLPLNAATINEGVLALARIPVLGKPQQDPQTAYRNIDNSFTSGQSITGNATISGVIFERGRALALGNWVDYAPVLTGIVIADGSLNGRYTRIGKTVHFIIQIITGPSTTYTGTFQATTPTHHRQASGSMTVGDVTILSPGSAYYYGKLIIVASPTFTLYTSQQPAAGVGPTNPFVFGPGAQLYMYGTYEEP